ncbi:MAG: sugar isomerase [Candidatus Parabeggiatoa sp. nov. 1]|nr:MAG: sugar isomerase [Gammaproteobacteria bacterium]
MLSELHKKGFFDLLSVNFLTQFLGFGTLLLVAKFLTPTEFGQIKIIQSYAAVFLLLAGFGLNTAVLKFCAENRVAEEKESILKLAIQRTIVASFLVLILLSGLAFTNIITSSREQSSWLLIYAIGIPFAALTALLMIYLQALKKIKQMTRVQAIIKLQSFVVIIVSTWIWGFQGFIFSTVAAYIIGLIPLIKQIGINFLKNPSNKTIPNNFMSIAIFSLLANGVSMIGQYADIFILDHFTNDREAIGYYSLATILILGATQVTNTVQSIATPYFSERGHDKTWFYQKLFQTQTRMAALSVVVAIGVYVIAWFIVHFFYGENYIVTLSYLRILLLKYIMWSSCAIIGVSLVGLGLMRYNLTIVAISTPVGVILSYFLLQTNGILGVAWAQVLASFVMFILVLLISRIALRRYFSTPSFKRKKS